MDTCIFGIGRGPCERKVENARQYAEDVLPRQLDGLLDHLKLKLTPNKGRIYITGYAKFFNAETTQCNFVSLALFTRKALYQDRRVTYNGLIELVNSKIQEAAERAGPQVAFVNYDPYFGQCGGRLCEEGVWEPNAHRAKLLFFQRGGTDIVDSTRQGSRPMKRRLSGVNSIFRLPDSDLRIFHPRSTGQRIIAEAIMAHMKQDQAKARGLGQAVLEAIACPA